MKEEALIKLFVDYHNFYSKCRKNPWYKSLSSIDDLFYFLRSNPKLLRKLIKKYDNYKARVVANSKHKRLLVADEKFPTTEEDKKAAYDIYGFVTNKDLEKIKKKANKLEQEEK